MTRFEVHQADDETRAFLASELSQGHTLLRELGQLVDGTLGQCSIYAPEGISAERLRKDRLSPLAFEPIARRAGPPDGPNPIVVAEDVQELVTELALERLRSVNESLLIIEDAMARRNDPVELRMAHDKLYCADRVYRLVASSANTRQKEVLDIVLASASSFSWAMALCRSSRSSFPPPGSEIASSDVRALGRHTEWLALEAYDGDGLLVWTRVS